MLKKNKDLPLVSYIGTIALAFSWLGSATLANSTDQLIIKTRDCRHFYRDDQVVPVSKSMLGQLSELAGVPLTYFRCLSDGSDIYRLPSRASTPDLMKVVQALAADPMVALAEIDYIAQPTLEPNDPHYATYQWHFKELAGSAFLPAAWDVTTGSSDVVVAVIDTGMRPHIDLTGKFLSGYDFITNISMANDGDSRDNDPTDPGDWTTEDECYSGSPARSSSWHGTFVSGLIGAQSNNGGGVAGIAWESPILPLRVLGKCGGYVSDIIDAIRWAAGLSVAGVVNNPTPAQVINMSLGVRSGCGESSQSAIDDAVAAGAIIITSAGNLNLDLSENDYWPAICDNVVTVAATGPTGGRAYYSNFGTAVDIAAPGGDKSFGTNYKIFSTVNMGTTTPGADAYGFQQGTSASAPHVAGIAALVLAQNPELSPAQILTRLQATTRPFPTGTPSDCTTSLCGAGLIDAAAAVVQPVSPLISVTASDAEASELGPDPGAFTFTVSANLTSPLVVHFTLSGTAENGVDYKNVPSSLELPIDTQQAALVIEPLADNENEEAETVILTLEDNNDYIVVSPSSATVSIQNGQIHSGTNPDPVDLPAAEADGGGCLARALLEGTPQASLLTPLRQARDSLLKSLFWGRRLVDFYYWLSPVVSQFLNINPGWRGQFQQLIGLKAANENRDT